MAPTLDPHSHSEQARGLYVRQIALGLERAAETAVDASKALLTKAAPKEVVDRRLDAMSRLVKGVKTWRETVVRNLRSAQEFGAATLYGRALVPDPALAKRSLSLVDDAAMELEVIATRMSQSILDRSNSEFNYLRTRICALEEVAELSERDMLRPHVLARMALEDWRACDLPFESWVDIQYEMQDAFTHLVNEAYYETNRWLREQGVLSDIDPRHHIRRSSGGVSPVAPLDRLSPAVAAAPAVSVMERLQGLISAGVPASGMQVAPGGWSSGDAQPSAGVGPFGQASATPSPFIGHPAMSPGLAQAVEAAVHGYISRLRALGEDEAPPEVPEVIEQLDEQRREIKQSAGTREERSTIEIVALLFQNILAEDRVPPGLRVWFARLQVPVMRVAISEPEFFADLEHPARRLIDRMGECVLGLGGSAEARSDDMEQEVRRIVQVIEAYPETGSRVFRTVLEEFERFLEGHFQGRDEATRKGVSLAQRIEQRETLAVRYTIELRKMLEKVPVADGVRAFLFDVWADVMATVGVAEGVGSDRALQIKRVAADLIWSAAAKVSREERADVLKRLPALQRALREGMSIAGLDPDRQESSLKQVNEALAAGFTAKAAAIPSGQIEQLTAQFEALEDLLPDAADFVFDEAMVRDINAIAGSELELVTTGGDEPSAETVERAKSMGLGAWFELRLGDGSEPVHLVWRGMRGQLYLFMAAEGSPRLFQLHRLAAYCQAGLLKPLEEESMTARASRRVLDILLAEPERLEH